MSSEKEFIPQNAMGRELDYNDAFHIKGQLTAAQLEHFIKTRRQSNLGPVTVYYAGLVAPAISAGAYALFDFGFRDLSVDPIYKQLLVLLCSATAGLVWFLIFNRLAQRSGNSRELELTAETELHVSRKGLIMRRQHIEKHIAWPAIMDIRTTKHYIVLAIEGAEDIFIPAAWFGSKQAMTDALEKIASFRPPPAG
jgi:hypothetical protein